MNLSIQANDLCLPLERPWRQALMVYCLRLAILCSVTVSVISGTLTLVALRHLYLYGLAASSLVLSGAVALTIFLFSATWCARALAVRMFSGHWLTKRRSLVPSSVKRKILADLSSGSGTVEVKGLHLSPANDVSQASGYVKSYQLEIKGEPVRNDPQQTEGLVEVSAAKEI